MYHNIVFLRGFSAFLVVIFHWRAVFFGSYAHTDSVIEKIFYGVTGYGTAAVYVFFAVSGVLMYQQVQKICYISDCNSFILKRTIRLWVVLIPLLILSIFVEIFIADEIKNGLYRSFWGSGPNFNNYSVSVENFFSTLFFMNEYIFGVYGINSPLWSLSIEGSFYFLIFLFWKTIVDFTSLKLYQILITLIFVLFIFNKWFVMLSLIIPFSIGYFKEYFLKLKFFVTLCLLTNIILVRIYPNDILFLFLSINIAFFIYSTIDFKFTPKIYNFISIFSKFSFSLYVTHFLILMLIFGSDQKEKWIISYIPTAYLLAYLYYLLTERHTHRIYKLFGLK